MEFPDWPAALDLIEPFWLSRVGTEMDVTRKVREWPYQELAEVLLGPNYMNYGGIIGAGIPTGWWLNTGTLYLAAYSKSVSTVLLTVQADSRLCAVVVMGARIRPRDDELQVLSCQLLALGVVDPVRKDDSAVGEMLKVYADSGAPVPALFEEIFR